MAHSKHLWNTPDFEPKLVFPLILPAGFATSGIQTYAVAVFEL
jgi:hypothetical protein